MKREVVITTRAQTEIENILDYLETRWSLKTKKKFLNKINLIINLVVENPELFPVSNVNKRVRKAVIT